MNEISPLGWVIIAILVVILIATNLSLLTLFRSRSKHSNPSDPLPGLFQAFKNPWEKEDQQWRELSNQVDKLGHQDRSSATDPNPEQKD